MKEINLDFPVSADGDLLKVKIKKSTAPKKSKRLKMNFVGRTLQITHPSSLDQRAVREAIGFFNGSLPWVKNQISLNPAILDKDLEIGKPVKLYLRGSALNVVWVKGQAKSGIVFCSETKMLSIHYNSLNQLSAIKTMLRNFYEKELMKDVHHYLTKWLPTIPGGSIKSIRVAPTSSKWGSMSSDHRLSLNFNLIYGKPSALEYVIIHELVHQIHMNHSSAFWSEVKKRMINYREQELYLEKWQGFLAVKSDLIF